jgi:hypothetical protein
MKKYVIFLLFALTYATTHPQTVVKMTLPPQGQQPLNVEVLFDEEVPEGIPVVLGLIGYKVTGGIEPYTYEWIQNGKVIGTGDIVMITPAKGDQFELKAIDKNKCYSTSSFNLRMATKSTTDKEQNQKFKIYPTIVKDDVIHIDFQETDAPMNANIRIFSLKGILLFQTMASQSCTVTHSLTDGFYFVSVQTDGYHQVEKIIVQH